MSYNADLILIVDESGSMMPQRSATIASINELVQDQRKQPGNLAITQVNFGGQFRLWSFAGGARTVRERIPAESFEYLTPEDYDPRGSTPLNDAICSTLKSVRQWPKPASDHDTIVVIVTDGEENASTEHSNADVKALVEELTAAGWKFHFVGANIDAFSTGAQYGIRSTAQVDLSNPIGTAQAYRGISATVTSLRAQP